MSSPPIRALLIEDNPADADFLREMLSEDHTFAFTLECVDRLDRAFARLAQDGIDVVLSDLSLPDSQGLETFNRLHARVPGLPIVVMTGVDDDRIAVEAVRRGAQDYLVKGHADARLLVRIIRYAIERKRAEEQIRTSLHEKEVLLKEVHHRVKNNLQIVSSLLNLQADASKDPAVRGLLAESRSRIHSMALVHEILYDSKNLSAIEMAGYIRTLVSHIAESYAARPGQLSLAFDVVNRPLGVDVAIPCGLILNELVANVFKHAFPEGRGGQVRVAFREASPGRLALTVSDNGVGFPPTVDFRATESLGLRLVTTLTEQLGGTLELTREGGTTFRLAFPDPECAEPALPVSRR